MTGSSALLAIGMPGGTELLIILVIVLLLFGRKIPGLARSLGSGITEFKKGLREGEESGKQLEGEVRKPPKEIEAPGPVERAGRGEPVEAERIDEPDDARRS